MDLRQRNGEDGTNNECAPSHRKHAEITISREFLML
jgi:hypothetical protein